MRRPVVTALLLSFALSLCACGRETTTKRERDGVIEVTMVDFRMRPQVIRAPDGELVVQVDNAGRLPHNFRIRGLGGTRLKIATLLPGERGRRSFKLGKGDWRIFCSIGNHEELGMYGTLVTR
jgi:hypothetical protein